MSLPHALLTALSEHACSGSELARRFDRSIGYFWAATHQQIYRELSRLERDGLVVSEAIEAAPGRRRVYRVLPAGAGELRRWLEEAREPKAIRDDLLVKVRAEAFLGSGAIADTVELRLQRHRARLAEYREIEARGFPEARSGREQRLLQLILGAGIDLETLWVKLCEGTIATIEDESLGV